MHTSFILYNSIINKYFSNLDLNMHLIKNKFILITQRNVYLIGR